jgi:hypothetical protein
MPNKMVQPYPGLFNMLRSAALAVALSTGSVACADQVGVRVRFGVGDREPGSWDAGRSNSARERYVQMDIDRNLGRGCSLADR